MQLLKIENFMLKIFKVDQALVFKNHECQSVKKKKLHFHQNSTSFQFVKMKTINVEREKENLCFDHCALLVAKLLSHLIGKHAILRLQRPPIT